MRTLVPGSKAAVWPPSTSSSPTTQLFSPTFSSNSLPSATRTTAWRRETSGLSSTTPLAGSRPMVTSAVVHLDHRAAALVDLVVPDLHGAAHSRSASCGRNR